MAADIGAKITLQGEKQYREQMRQITQQTKTMRAETQAMEAEWNKSATAQQKAAQQTEMLRTQIDRQKQSVDTARANVERYSAAYGENSAKTLKWKQTLAEAEVELARLQAELEKVPNSLQIMGQKMQESGQKMQKVGKAMSTVGSGMTKAITVPLVGMATAAVKTTADFDESMSKVKALSGATGTDFDKLRQKARDMGKTTKYSASESAEALSYMALAGWDTNQMLDGLDGVMNLAAASGMDLAEASDIVTDYLSAFGLQASDSAKMADKMAYAQAHSNTTTTQLGEAFGNSAAQMHTAGQSMETTTAILEAFANQGLKGSEAGTALSAMMRDITQKMKNGKIQIGDTTVAVQDQNGNFRNMVDILTDVEAATDGMGSAEKSAALMTTFTARSVKGVSMALTEGTGNIRRYRDELERADGTAKTMAETMQDNLKGQLTILKSQLQELGISFGDILVPQIRKAVEWVQKQVDRFNSLDSATKEQIVKFASLAAAIGPVLLVGGKLTTSIGKMVEGGGKAIEWLGKLSSGFGGATTMIGKTAAAFGPFGLAIAGVVGAVALAKAGYENFRQTAKETNGDLYSSIDAVNETTSALNGAGDNIEKCFSDADKAIQDVEASAKAATTVADEIEELTSKSKLTREEQIRLKALVGEMNQLFPEMGLAIDETTGALNRSNDEIREYIDNAYKMAKAEAYANALKTAMMAMADAEFKAAQAGIAHDRLLEEQAELEKEVAAATEERDGITRAAALTDTDAATKKAKLNEEIITGKAALEDAQKALDDNKSAQEENSKALEDAQKAYDDAYKVLEDYAEQMGVTVDELLNMGDAEEETTAATEDYEEAIEDATDATEDFAAEVEKAWNEAYDAALDSATKQEDIFGKLAETTEISTEEMIQNLQSHADSIRNWNSNVNRLTSDVRYKTDANFRAIVDYLITNTTATDGQLDQFVRIFEEGGENLETILGLYGEYVNELGPEYAKGLADAKVSAEYGISQIDSAFATGFEGLGRIAKESGSSVIKKAAQVLSDKEGMMARFASKGWANVEKKTSKEASATGKTVAGSYNSAVETTGKKTSFKSVIKATVSELATVAKQATTAKVAGEAVSKAMSLGIDSGRAGVASSMTSIRTTISQNITQISNLKSNATNAGKNIAGGLQSGFGSGTSGVTGAINAIKSSISTSITSISALKSNAETAGSGIASSLASGISGKQSSVQSASQSIADAAKTPLQTLGNSSDPTTWGRHVGDNFANGLGGANGNASTNGRQLANAAKAPLEEMGNSNDPWTWGRHMGDNFANGIGSAYANVVAQARLIANAAASILRHSTPKEGPLKNDDVWGLHLAQNFAEGMRQGVPAVKSAASAIADTVAAIPTTAVMDIDAVSGRNVASAPLSQVDLMDAVMMAAEQIDWKVVIGNREFGRILRAQGAIA